MIGGLTIIGLFIGIFFGFDTGDPLERDATLRVLRCQYGYDLINGQCIDRNECTGTLHACHLDATCHNNDGSYSCKCNLGYEDINGDGKACQDINECAIETDKCDKVRQIRILFFHNDEKSSK